MSNDQTQFLLGYAFGGEVRDLEFGKPIEPLEKIQLGPIDPTQRYKIKEILDQRISTQDIGFGRNELKKKLGFETW